MKILCFGSSHKSGLAGQEVELAAAYKKINQIELQIVSGEKEQNVGLFAKLEKLGIKYQIINGLDEHGRLFCLLKEITSICKQQDFDFVTVNTNWQLFMVGCVKHINKFRFKIIYTVHGFRHNEPIKSVFARIFISLGLLSFAHKVHVPTGYVAKKFGILKKYQVIVPLGEDPIFFDNSTSPKFNTPYSFVFAGVFRKGKNQDLLIKAFAKYIQLSGDSDSKLILPGDGPLRVGAIALANDLGLKGRVEFPGYLDRNAMVQCYLNSQFAIVPSNDETFGHCITEPFILQRIVITRNIGIAQELIKDGENGFIFNSMEDLVKLLLKIRNEEQTKLTLISKETESLANLFNWERIAGEHVSKLFLISE